MKQPESTVALAYDPEEAYQALARANVCKNKAIFSPPQTKKRMPDAAVRLASCLIEQVHICFLAWFAQVKNLFWQ